MENDSGWLQRWTRWARGWLRLQGRSYQGPKAAPTPAARPRVRSISHLSGWGPSGRSKPQAVRPVGRGNGADRTCCLGEVFRRDRGLKVTLSDGRLDLRDKRGLNACQGLGGELPRAGRAKALASVAAAKI
jgi:hypothetical protein